MSRTLEEIQSANIGVPYEDRKPPYDSDQPNVLNVRMDKPTDDIRYVTSTRLHEIQTNIFGFGTRRVFENMLAPYGESSPIRPILYAFNLSAMKQELRPEFEVLLRL